MSSLEKRHTSRRGSMQGHHKYSDGFSDTSSVGSFMDETDREVSNLTDRAFRSLCIGEEAIYNDSEISSPTERHRAFAEEIQQKEVLQTTCQETFSYGIQYGEAERKSEATSTFQHSYVDVTQEQVLRGEHMSYMSNGSMEATWQQKRSSSRVSSLIKAFSSREGYSDSATPDAILLRDNYRDFHNGSWDKSAMLSIQRELFSSANHQNFQSYRNHLVSRMDTTASLFKSSKTKFQALNSTNFFFHSEFSPFQLWKDYNRFPFEREEPSGFVSASEFPRWYDSPLYKELTATHTFSNEGRRFNRRKIEDVVPTQRSRSTVIQKASAIEKRCESEMASNCPPWRRNDNFVRSKLPSNRPSTVSPTNEKLHRPDSSLLSHNRHIYDFQHRVQVRDNEMSSSSTPFNITQLLTPANHARQETETSEILQFAQTPSVPDYSVQGDVDQKSLPDVQQLRDSYKSKASSLLFNLKDNRKRVKSTYSPKFKGLEIPDWNKQSLTLEDLESRLSDTSLSHVTTQEYSTAPNTWELGEITQQKYVHLSQTIEHKKHADGAHDNVASQYGTGNYKISCGDLLSHNSLHPDKLSNKENEENVFSPHMLSAQNKSTRNSEGHIYDPSGTLSPSRLETENIFSNAYPPAQSLLAQMSEKQTISRREDVGHHDLKERQNFGRKPQFGYTQNQITAEELPWKDPGPISTGNNEIVNNNLLSFKGEIAALVEMDKQRKATAKQYLPSANDRYSTGKETYINKVNENIKQGRLMKEESVQDIEGSLQKYSYANKIAQEKLTNIPSTSQNLYGFQNNSLNKTTSSPPKEANFKAGFESTKHDKVKVCFQRGSNTAAEEDYRQKIQCSASLEEKHQENEGSIAYQPYKYEPNKQWHIATESRHTMDEVCIPRQLQQTEKKSEQPGETHYTYSISGTSDIEKESIAYTTRTTQRNVITEDRVRTGEHKPNDSSSPKQVHQIKDGDIKTNITKLNIQNVEPSNSSSQAKEDRFSINDILSIRDNEQAKRIKENKHSLIANVSDPSKIKNLSSPVTPSIAEEKISDKIDAFKVNEQTTQDPISHYKHANANMSYGNIRKESHNQNEGLLNIGTAVKDKPGKEAYTNDRITPKTLSYKEKGQTKQEILTSKLKAHAQKEISAIKEKGLAKQGILSRNPMKLKVAIHNEKGQMNQDVLSPKKEITAEKLNHLFQDITYSSVTSSYKEHSNLNQEDKTKYESLSAEEIKPSVRAIDSQTDAACSEKKKNEAFKDDKLTANEREHTKVQPVIQNLHLEDERIKILDTNMYEVKTSIENLASNTCTDNQKIKTSNYSTEHETILTKSLSSSPAIKTPNKEASVIKTEEQISANLPTVYSADLTENPIIAKGKDSKKYVSLTSSSEQTKLFDYPVNKTLAEPSNVKVDRVAACSDTAYQKCADLAEMTRLSVENKHHVNQNKVEKEKHIKEPNENIVMSVEQIKSPSDWKSLKDDALLVESTAEPIDTKTSLPTEHRTNSVKEKEHLKSRDSVIKVSEPSQHAKIQQPKTLEVKEKESPELCTKQDIKVQINSTFKTTEDSQQLQHSNIYKEMPSGNAHRTKGNQITPKSNEQEHVKPLPVDVNECSQIKELKQKKEDLHSGEDKAQQGHQPKQEITKNDPVVKTDTVTESNSQQPQQESDKPKDSENQIQQVKYPHDKIENASTEIQQSKNKNVVNANNSQSTVTENENSCEQVNSHAVLDKSDNAPGSQISHIPIKEDDPAPVDEPIIYSIRVSSKSDAVSEDEPVIYTICVSAISDNSMIDDRVSHNKSNSVQTPISADGEDKKEASGSTNEQTEEDCLESKASDSKKAKECISTDEAQKVKVVRNHDSGTTKDKYDSYRSTEVSNISSSYESLLVKYGFRENVNLKSNQKEDKLEGTEDKFSTKHLSENVQLNSKSTVNFNSDVAGRQYQESRKSKPTEEAPELLNDVVKNKQDTTYSVTTNGGSVQKVTGVRMNSDKNIKDKQNGMLQNEKDVTEKQKAPILKVVPTCEDSRNIQPTITSKQNTKYDSLELMGNKQVVQKGQAEDFTKEKRKKQKETDNVLSKNADTVTSENDIQKSKYSTAEISSPNINNSTVIASNNSHEDSLPPNSKISVTIKDSKTIEKEILKSYDCNRVARQDTARHLYKHKPDTAPVQDSQKAITETIKTINPQLQHEGDTFKPYTLNKEYTPDHKTLQNRKELIRTNELSEQEQAKFKTCNETKDKGEIGLTSFNKQSVEKENCSVGEDLTKKASNAVKVNQNLFKAPSIQLEDKKVDKKELKINKDHLISQQQQIKTDSVSANGVVLCNDSNSLNTFPKVTGEKAVCMGDKEDGSKRLEIQKGKEEPASRQQENVNNIITPRIEDNAKQPSHLVKKDTEGEPKKGVNNKKEVKAQTLDKKDEREVATDKVGLTKSATAVVVKESSESFRKEVESSGEVLRVKNNDRINVYEYHPGKGFLPETNVNMYDQQSTIGSSHHDTVHRKKDITCTKSGVTQSEKKATRPEISALADYARLRVISVEDDSTSEKDLLQRIETYQKYNLSAVESLKENMSTSVGGTEPNQKLTINKIDKNQSWTRKPFQVQEPEKSSFQNSKLTEGALEEHNKRMRNETNTHPKLSSLDKMSDERVFAVKVTERNKEKTITNQMQPNTKSSLTERHYRYQRDQDNHVSQNPHVKHTLLSQVEDKNDDSAKLRQSDHAEELGKGIYPHVKHQESLSQASVGNMLNKAKKQADQPENNVGEKVEELEYYTVSNTESISKPKEVHDRITSKKEAPEISTTGSNTSSPAMGKPTMFRVKDNTIRTLSVTKAVKPRFHRSFSEEFRIGSPKEMWSSSEKINLEHDHEPDPKDTAVPPVLHEPAGALHRLARMKEIQSQNSLPSAEIAVAKEPRSYLRRNQMFEDDETRSVISTMSEDVESLASSPAVMTDSRAAHVFETKSSRDTYARPGSACYTRPESACYERPESACYERPESACSDMRPLGRPPTVPPKTEKALRRAKKLTTRRIKKAEDKMTSESQGQLEIKSFKSVQAVSSLPSSPMELVSTHAVQASPPVSHYHAPSLMAHSFPVTQRKLLQDPNSGQYFMVDMPVQVKTKTFFDPETGKYVQLNVRQRTQSTLSQPQSVEVLNHSYVVYPGFLPMSVSSLPTLRSSSQMSAPATLMEEQNKLEESKEPRRQNNHKKVEQYSDSEYGLHEHAGSESSYAQDNISVTSRQTDIITMSELEDFAMENT